MKDKSEREVIHEFVKRLKVGISNSEMAVSERWGKGSGKSVRVQERRDDKGSECESSQTRRAETGVNSDQQVTQQNQWQRAKPGNRGRAKERWRCRHNLQTHSAL